MNPIRKITAALLLLAAAPLAQAYDNSGQCADAVVSSCNSKYEGGKALNSCVSSGVDQCIKQFPATAPAPRPGLAGDKIAAPVRASRYKNAGECADAVVSDCNGKYEGGAALNSCVGSGVDQCIAAFPDSGAAPAQRPGPGGPVILGTPPTQPEFPACCDYCPPSGCTGCSAHPGSGDFNCSVDRIKADCTMLDNQVSCKKETAQTAPTRPGALASATPRDIHRLLMERGSHRNRDGSTTTKAQGPSGKPFDLTVKADGTVVPLRYKLADLIVSGATGAAADGRGQTVPVTTATGLGFDVIATPQGDGTQISLLLPAVQKVREAAAR